MDLTNYICLKNVNKVLKGKQILNNVDLQLERGKTYVFAGRNASGKTMLFRAVSGLLTVDSGSVTVFGEPISEKCIFPSNMGLIIETIEMWPHLTGLENLELIASIRNIVSKNEMREALTSVGLDPDDKRKYKAYSMGMKQKLALAQAIMEKPELLVLDEPTNGLDEESVALFREIIKKEKQRGVTCLIATHQLDDVDGLYESLYHMKNGECIKGEDVC